jgi:hypothetical protein
MLTSAYSLLTNWKQDAYNIMRILGLAKDGTNGNDDEEHALNTNGWKSKKDWLKDKVNIMCHKCGQKLHYANECKNEHKVEREAEATLVMAGMAGVTDDFDEADHVHFQFLQMGTYADYRSVVLNRPLGAVPKAWILLNNQSTVNVFYNKELLGNVQRSDTHMDIHNNAGITSTEVWYHPNGIANILSLTKKNTESHLIAMAKINLWCTRTTALQDVSNNPCVGSTTLRPAPHLLYL